MTQANILAASGSQGVAQGFKNRIINGAMVIDQRNAGASVATTSGFSVYTVDRWAAFYAQTSKYTIQQNAGSVTPPVGFNNYLGVTSSSAYSSISTDFFALIQRIEGFNFADLNWGTANAKTVTISAWVYSSLTGTFSGAVLNSAETRTYPFTYSIPVANTWTQISVTIAGDTSGTWIGATNGIGLEISFNLGSGSTKLGTAGSWQAAGYLGATGSVSVVGTSGATFYITGVQLEVGSSATGFEYRQYQQELALCQRYYWQLAGAFNNGSSAYFHYGIGFQTTTTQSFFVAQYPVTMRAAPSFTAVNPANFYVNTNTAVSAITLDQAASQTTSYYTTNTAVASAYSGTRLYGIVGTTNSLLFNAEL